MSQPSIIMNIEQSPDELIKRFMKNEDELISLEHDIATLKKFKN